MKLLIHCLAHGTTQCIFKTNIIIIWDGAEKCEQRIREMGIQWGDRSKWQGIWKIFQAHLSSLALFDLNRNIKFLWLEEFPGNIVIEKPNLRVLPYVLGWLELGSWSMSRDENRSRDSGLGSIGRAIWYLSPWLCGKGPDRDLTGLSVP